MFEKPLGTSLRGRLFEDYPLARHSSWHIGGSADIAYQPADIKDCQAFFQWLHKTHPTWPVTWLGLGSNVLLPDDGFKGVVILPKYGLKALAHEAPNIRAEAGATCAKLAKLSEKLGYMYGAFFAGIPGTVGGALAMNAGAFGHETWSYVVSVEVISPEGDITTHPAADFSWGYRRLQGLKPGHWFVAATFCFPEKKDGEAVLDVKGLLAKRQESQPIGSKNCGSVFKNPEGHHAAQLIDSLGLKGLREGDMVVSEKHANFIINEGDGTSEQTCALIALLQKKVHEAYDIWLEPEVRMIKDNNNE